MTLNSEFGIKNKNFKKEMMQLNNPDKSLEMLLLCVCDEIPQEFVVETSRYI